MPWIVRPTLSDVPMTISKSTSSRSSSNRWSNSSESISLQYAKDVSQCQLQATDPATDPKKTMSGLTSGLPSHSLFGGNVSSSSSSNAFPFELHLSGTFAGVAGAFFFSCSASKAVHRGQSGTLDAKTSASMADPGNLVRQRRQDAVANEPWQFSIFWTPICSNRPSMF